MSVQSHTAQADASRDHPVVGAQLQKGEQLHKFEDGDETITVRTREFPGARYIAVDNENPDVAGFGFSTIGAIANLFEKLPRAASDREERDEQAARFDRALDLRKHGETV